MLDVYTLYARYTARVHDFFLPYQTVSGAEGWKRCGVHSSAEIPYQLAENVECFQPLTFSVNPSIKPEQGKGGRQAYAERSNTISQGNKDSLHLLSIKREHLLIFSLGTDLEKKMSRKRKLFPNVLWWPFYVTGSVTSFSSCLLCSLFFFCSENARRAAYCPCIWRSFTNLYLWLLFLQDCYGQRTRPRSALCYYKTYYPFA